MKLSLVAQEAYKVLRTRLFALRLSDVKLVQEVNAQCDAASRRTGTAINTDEREYIAKCLMALIGVKKESDGCIYNKSIYGKKPHWFTDIKKSCLKRYYSYKSRLIDKGWGLETVRGLDQSSDDIMNFLGDPRESSFSVRGLIMGDVQSGKTANFIALSNKAVDAGYKLIIVAAGIIEDLRKQTQQRLNSELTVIVREEPLISRTSVEKDFGKKDVQIPLQCSEKPVLLVVKKNVSILQSVVKWIEQNIEPGQEKLNIPLLFIDDEADHASINTRDISKEADPTKINANIRKIIGLTCKSAYVGITATPFANVFIDPDVANDLFPRNFVYRLTPPNIYFGIKSLLDKNHSEYIQDLDDIEKWLPTSHHRGAVVSSSLPLSLKKAICYFLLVNGILDWKKANNKPTIIHRTMMVHVSRFIAIHRKIAYVIKQYVDQVCAAVVNFGAMNNYATSHEDLCLLHSLWKDEHLAKQCGNISWRSFVANFLMRSIDGVCIKIVNSKNDKLFYEDDKPAKIIAVGGNALSRGLTLNGLSVSYFRRETLMSDTLLQMARWNGYHEEFRDLIRVWMNKTIRDHFEYASEISDELAQAFSSFQNDPELTPFDYALRIRTDPASMLPTARNKMRSAKTARVPIALSGHAIETPRLIASMTSLADNKKLVNDFLHAFNGDIEKRDWKGVRYLSGVSSDKVAEFVGKFRCGVMSCGFRNKDIAAHIKSGGGVWDVAFHVANDNGDQRKDETNIRRAERYLSLVNGEILINGTKLKVTSGGEMHLALSRKIKKSVDDNMKGARSASDSDYLAMANRSLLVIQCVKQAKGDTHGKREKKVIERNEILNSDIYALSVGFAGEVSPRSATDFYLTKRGYNINFNSEVEA